VIRGDRLTLDIEKPAVGGRMIARADGAVLLVAGAIPGERVEAIVERVARGVAYARATAVLEPSPDRRSPFCDPLCGGSFYAHIDYGRQLQLKAEVIADALRRTARLALPAPLVVAPSREDGYRMRARLHLAGGRLGFYREGTHELCDARSTRQLLSATFDALDRLNGVVRSLTVQSVREVEIAENADASMRVVHLATASTLDAALIDRLASVEGLTGLSAHETTRGDVHVVDRVTPVEGRSLTLRRHVLAFFQGNRYLLDPFVAHVVQQLDDAKEIIDLYAGVGLFAVAAAAAGSARVTAVEGDPIAAADLDVNARTSEGAVTPVHSSVEHFVETNSAVTSARSTLIVDPPRTGLSPAALEGAIRLSAGRMIYVSCDVATFARDARRLVDAGYTLRQLAAFDLFPNTPHVETVGVFAQ
jgi:23S rRNA (uracil1939-C5)-methyltransferase